MCSLLDAIKRSQQDREDPEVIFTLPIAATDTENFYSRETEVQRNFGFKLTKESAIHLELPRSGHTEWVLTTEQHISTIKRKLTLRHKDANKMLNILLQQESRFDFDKVERSLPAWLEVKHIQTERVVSIRGIPEQEKSSRMQGSGRKGSRVLRSHQQPSLAPGQRDPPSSPSAPTRGDPKVVTAKKTSKKGINKEKQIEKDQSQPMNIYCIAFTNIQLGDWVLLNTGYTRTDDKNTSSSRVTKLKTEYQKKNPQEGMGETIFHAQTKAETTQQVNVIEKRIQDTLGYKVAADTALYFGVPVKTKCYLAPEMYLQDIADGMQGDFAEDFHLPNFDKFKNKNVLPLPDILELVHGKSSVMIKLKGNQVAEAATSQNPGDLTPINEERNRTPSEKKNKMTRASRRLFNSEQ